MDAAGLDNLRVVLVAPRNPLNIGAVARAMKNFGFHRLALVNPYETAFREARSAVDARDILAGAEQFDSLSEAVRDSTLVVGTTAVGHRELQLPLRRLEHGARIIKRRLARSPVTLLFGSEKFGLSNEDMSYCHWLMRIPTADIDLSMNLGQAAAVCLYELIRSPGAATSSQEKRKPALQADVDRVAGMLLEALHISGYVNSTTETSTVLKIRRIVRRMDITAADAPFWLGMLRQILWRLRENRE